MSQFASNYAAVGTPAMNQHFGETITYTPDGGSPVSRTARVITEPADRDQTERGERTYYYITVVLANDATTGITAAAIGDVVTYDSTDYKVESTQIEEQEWVLRCKTWDDGETTMPGTREDI